MSEILLPEKIRVLNSATRFPISFLDAAGAPVAAASAVQMDVKGFGKTKIEQVKRISLARGLSPSLQQFTIDSAQVSEITVGAIASNNTRIAFEFSIESTNREMRLARPEYEFGITNVYNVNAVTTDTAATILQKLNSAINAGSHRNRDFIITSSYAAGVLTIDVLTRGVFIDKFEVKGADSLASSIVTVFAPVESRIFHKGIGYGSDIEFREKMQYKNNIPYHFDLPEIPQEDQLYSVIAWEIQVNRPDRKSSILSDRVRHILYMNEAVTESVIDSLGDFFLTNPATRATALETDGISVGFNYDGSVTPLTNTAAASSASNLDSDHAGLTVIKGALNAADSYFIGESIAIDDTLDDFLNVRFKANA